MKFLGKSMITKPAVVATVSVVAVGGAAFAYWTTTGSGDGGGTVGTTSLLTVAQDTPNPTLLAPGSGTQPLNFTVTNPGTGGVQVTSVAIDLSGTTWQTLATFPDCSAADFTIVQPSFSATGIAGGGNAVFTSTGGTITTGATIAMNNTGANQNACKGQVLNVHYAVS